MSNFVIVNNLLGSYPEELVIPLALEDLVVSTAVNFEVLQRSSLKQGMLIPVVSFRAPLRN
jgi:hypothetical protein